MFGVRTVVAVLVASVVLGFLITPGSSRPTDNAVLAVARQGVEGLAATGRGLVEFAGQLVSDHVGR